jgi:20S proteasome subunit beta 6
MFSLDKSYSISKVNNPELFPIENTFKRRIENTSKCLSFSSDFDCTKLPSSSNSFSIKNPMKVHATEEDLYENNAGTTLTITVDNKIIIASDTRHSSEYTINSRKMTKVFKIGNYFLTTVGFYPDGFEIYTKLLFEVKKYETYNKISVSSLAHLLHNVLYNRRFFPFYSYTCISGFENGLAKIFCYDPVGSYQETKCRCDGSGSKMIQPLLDSWIMGKNFKDFQELNFEGALALVKKAFDGAAERDVKTKDFLEIYVIDRENVKHEFIDLRKD